MIEGFHGLHLLFYCEKKKSYQAWICFYQADEKTEIISWECDHVIGQKNSFSKFTHQTEFFDQSHTCTLSFRFLHNKPIFLKIVHKVVNRQKFLNLFSVSAVLPYNIGAGNSNSDANLVLTIKAPISVTWFDFSFKTSKRIYIFFTINA